MKSFMKLFLIVVLALAGSTQARLADPQNETPSNELERTLFGVPAQCDAKLTCEDYGGYTGRLMMLETFFFGFFGFGCLTRCVQNFYQPLFLFFGWKCDFCKE